MISATQGNYCTALRASLVRPAPCRVSPVGHRRITHRRRSAARRAGIWREAWLRHHVGVADFNFRFQFPKMLNAASAAVASGTPLRPKSRRVLAKRREAPDLVRNN